MSLKEEIRGDTKMTITRTEYTQSLREFADFLEAHPEVPLPFFQAFGWYGYRDKGRAGVVALAKALAHVRKDYDGASLWIRAEFAPGVTLCYGCPREEVCERVVTGTRIIPAQPEREEEIVEWRCVPLLAGE
jgi:hypothetical protein